MPDLADSIKKSIKKSSAVALKICIKNYDQFTRHTEIHTMAGRSLPQNLCLYRHAILLYKLVNTCVPENEHLHMNFQLLNNTRSSTISFRRSQNYGVGKNILLNRFVHLNNMIEKGWLSLSLETYKIKCKEKFL